LPLRFPARPYEYVKQNSLLTSSRNSMATTVYLRVSTGTFMMGKTRFIRILFQGQKIKAKTVRHPPAKAGLKGVHS
jgi:hypothetical protein